MTEQTARDRFMAKVEITESCWLWTASLDHSGYGRFRHNGETGGAHRAAYEIFVGPIPDGMTIDHLCHDTTCSAGRACSHRRCVNPAHLGPATHRENILRGNTQAAANAAKTHCMHGHQLTPENTAMHAGKRQCRQCLRDASTRYRLRNLGRAPGVWNVRKTHCKNGHEFTPENTYRCPHGWRQCLTCKRSRSQVAA